MRAHIQIDPLVILQGVIRREAVTMKKFAVTLESNDHGTTEPLDDMTIEASDSREAEKHAALRAFPLHRSSKRTGELNMEAMLCEVCDVDISRDHNRCTNGRCGKCHGKYCTPGGQTSPGHGRGRPPAILLAKGNGLQWWRLLGGQVYVAASNAATDPDGYPTPRKWECSITHWREYRSHYPEAVDVPRKEAPARK